MISVVCECSRDGCMALLPVSIEEYETLRATPTRFLLAEGHERPDLETVVEQTGEHLVVEKVGASAAVAVRMNPRGYRSEHRNR